MEELIKFISKLIKNGIIKPGFTGQIVINVHEEKPGNLTFSTTEKFKDLEKKLN